jgi:hypothetical protein
MFKHPNSVPTGADHRKAVICGVEGPVVVMAIYQQLQFLQSGIRVF